MIQSLSVRGLFTKFDCSLLAGFSRPLLSTSTWWTRRPTRRSTTEWWAWDAIQSNFNRCFTSAKSLKSLKNLSKFNWIAPLQLPTPLRTHPAYTAYYNWSRLIVLGIIPFVLLVYLNTKIYQVLICRKVSWIALMQCVSVSKFFSADRLSGWYIATLTTKLLASSFKRKLFRTHMLLIIESFSFESIPVSLCLPACLSAPWIMRPQRSSFSFIRKELCQRLLQCQWRHQIRRRRRRKTKLLSSSCQVQVDQLYANQRHKSNAFDSIHTYKWNDLYVVINLGLFHIKLVLNVISADQFCSWKTWTSEVRKDELDTNFIC